MSEELLKNIIDFIELKQALHKVDKSPLTVEERYIVELIKYIQELQAEVKEANENAAWWSRRFKAANGKKPDVVIVDQFITGGEDEIQR